MLHWPDLQKGYNKCSHRPQHCFLKTMLRTMWASLVLFWSIIHSKLKFGDKKKIHDKWMHLPSSQAQVCSSLKTGCECRPWTGKVSQLQTTPRVQNGHISVIQRVCRLGTCSNTIPRFRAFHGAVKSHCQFPSPTGCYADTPDNQLAYWWSVQLSVFFLWSHILYSGQSIRLFSFWPQNSVR